MMHRRWLRWLLGGLSTITIAFVLAYEAATFYRNIPSQTYGNKVVFVRPKTRVPEIARQLREAGVLTSRWKFRLLARATGLHRALKPGEYKFEIPTPPREVLRILTEGKVLVHKVTFPEGLTVADIASAFDTQPWADAVEIRRILFSPEMPRRFNLPSNTFEGFLFPNTYQFTRTDSAQKVVQTMVDQFERAISPEDSAKAKQYGFNLLKWVTLASIIEKESGVAQEQPLISSVFHNRLKIRMRLQSDPTVIYGIPNFNGNITKKDLQTPTPYNTYTEYGLPPGPIANPGATALHAAVNPATTDYLYFVARKDGMHAFSATYEEHAKNVAHYQLHRKVSATR